MEGILNQLLFMNRVPGWAEFVCVDSKRCVWAFKDQPVFDGEVWVKQKGSDCVRIGEMRYFIGDQTSIISVTKKI
jgi:hypothetical protein